MYSRTKGESPLGVALFFVALLLPLNGAAQDCIDYGDYIHWVGGVDTPGFARGVAVTGNLACIADDSDGLQVIDITDRENPQLVGTVNTPGTAADVEIFGGYAYVADVYDGLQVVDITIPENPQIVGSVDTPGWAFCIVIEGNYAFIADDGGGLQIIDITNPTDPEIVGFITTPGRAFGVAVSGNHAFVADGDAGLLAIDITNPSAPQIVGSVSTPDFARGVFVSGSHAYVACSHAGLQIIDVSDPQDPQIIANADALNFSNDVVVAGDLAYVANEDGLQVIDVAIPATPATVGSVDTPSYNRSLAVTGNDAYLACYSQGLQIIDIENPESPLEIGSEGTATRAFDVDVSGDFAYVSSFDAGLVIIDITNPANPVAMGSVDIPGVEKALAVAGNYAYVANQEMYLHAVDISDAENPQVVADPLHLGGEGQDIKIVGNYAYIAAAYGRLVVVDITDPETPQFMDRALTPGFASSVAVAGDYAYVATGTTGLYIVDISNPGSLLVVGSIDFSGGAYGVSVSGSYCYVAADLAGLQVVDVSNPYNPTIVHSVDTGNSLYKVTTEGAYAYASTKYSAMHVVDIAMPETARYVGCMDAYTELRTFTVGGGYIFVANPEPGLQILPTQCDDTTMPTTVWIHADGSGDVATIQEAVDAVAPGGTVLMGNGTYTGPGNRDVDFGTKNLILRSVTNDESACIIDCQGSESEPHRGLVIQGGQTVDTVVRGLTITNAWNNGGGGLRIANDSNPTVENCVFLDNTSSDGGGIFVMADSRPTITDCLFDGNSASNAGGALRFSFAYGTVTDCTFRENYGYWGGGGIYFYTSGGSVDNCLFVDNDCHTWGSALHIDQYESNPELENCTIYGGLGNAPSVYLRNDARPGFVNTIIAFNDLGPAFDCAGGSTAEMFSCDIYGNAGGNWTSCIADWLGDDGNIEADPLFCDAAGSNFTLRSESPCADTNAPYGQIGAFGVGCSNNLIYVPGDQPTIQAGINAAAPGDTVLVACDTYYEHDLTMASGVVLISETGHYDCVTIDAQQLGRVFDCADLDVATRIIGFTITGGEATTSGGGARFINCSLTVGGCLFTQNTAANVGGGFYGVYSDLQLESCVFTENTAGSGAGIQFTDSQPTLTGCFFGSNTASGYGGAIRLNGSSAEISGTVFAENSADIAGALFCNEGASPSLSGCTFYANSAPNGSALRAGTDSHPVLESTIIAFGVEGAAATCTESGDIDLSCCDVYGNAGGDYVNCLTDFEGVAGNISADPLFCDAAGGDFTLDWDSPCAPSGSGDCGLIGAWSPGCGEEPVVDVIGLYTDMGGTQNSLYQDTAGQFTAYLIVKNASDSSGISAWECALPVPDGMFLMGATLHGNGLNITDLPNFMVGVPEPLPWAENVVVADLQYLSTDLEPRSFYLTASDPSSIDPPAPCYLTVDNNAEPLVLVPSSGSVDEPVFYLNDPEYPPTGVTEDEIPVAFALDNSYPNPFNPMTTIRYSLPESRRVRLSIYDLKGRLVTTLVDEMLPAGRHEVTWRGRDASGRSAASGKYFYRLIAGDSQQTRAMTLVK